MARLKKITAMLIAMAMLLALIPCAGVFAAEAVSSGALSENITWTLDSDGVLTVSGTGDMADYTKTSEAPFYQNGSVKTLIIEDGITNIGNYVFCYCTALTSVSIPQSVTSIGDDAFYGCSKLTSVEIPEGVTSIGEYAFHYCRALTTVSLPSTLSRIGEYGFNNCSALTSMNIPEGVASIGDGAFDSCTSLAEITVATGNKSYKVVDGILFNMSGTVLVRYPIKREGTEYSVPESVTEIGGNAFASCSALTSVKIPDSVTSIGKLAFFNCSKLTSITVPKGVTSIGDGTFRLCSSLTSVSIPDGVTSIGKLAFFNCSKLTNITLPGSLETIDDRAFDGCGLTEVSIPAGVTTIGDGVFGTSIYNTYELAKITVSPDNKSYEDIDGILFNKDGTKIITYPPKKSGDSYSVPNTVTEIANYAFQSCSSLTNIEIPESVTSIGNYAFYGDKGLKSITLPKGLTSLGEGAFMSCSKLTSIEIPNGVTSIGSSAFSDCSALASVSIPDSVTSIGGSAFFYCSALASVNIPYGVTSIGNSTFLSCSALTSVSIPDSVTSIGDYTFRSCSKLTSIDIPYGVTSIGKEAFSYCSALTSVSIPASVTSIGSYAFNKCSSVEIDYAGTVKQWEAISADANIPNDIKVYAAPVAELAWDGENSVFGINFTVAGADGINIYANRDTEAPITAKLTSGSEGVGLVPKSSNSVYQAKATDNGVIGNASKPVSLYGLVARAVVAWSESGTDGKILPAQLDAIKKVISHGGFYIVDGKLCGAANELYSIETAAGETETKYTITLTDAAVKAGLLLTETDAKTNLDGTVAVSENGKTATITVSKLKLQAFGTAYLEEVELEYAPERITELEPVNDYEEVLDFTEIL